MVICENCGGRCDSGDMVGKICLECLEEERQRQLRSDSIVRMMNSPFCQMEMEAVADA